MQCRCSAAIYVNFPHHLYYHRPFHNSLHRVALAVLRGGQGSCLLPLKVAPTQPSVTAAFHLQSRRDSDCQMWEYIGWSKYRLTPANVLALNTLRPGQNGRHFADNIFKCIFLNENVWIPIKISLKFVPKGQINKIPALVQIMAWRRPGGKPLSEPMMVSFLMHICVTRPQWVKITNNNLQNIATLKHR